MNGLFVSAALLCSSEALRPFPTPAGERSRASSRPEARRRRTGVVASAGPVATALDMGAALRALDIGAALRPAADAYDVALAASPSAPEQNVGSG